MNELNDYLPLRLIIFNGEEDVGYGIVMGEITDRGAETGISFGWNGRRYCIKAKTSDLRAATEPQP